MTDKEYDAAERQNQIERDLARFYARNPGAATAAALSDPDDRNPMDMGTVSLEEIAQAMEFPGPRDMDFQFELMPILRKRLVWDIVPRTTEVLDWQAKMDVTPGSEDGNFVEEADSDARRANLLPLMPLVQLAAWEAGQVVSKTKALSANEDYEGTVMVLPEHDVTAEVAAGTLAVIANLLELNILDYGKAVTGE